MNREVDSLLVQRLSRKELVWSNASTFFLGIFKEAQQSHKYEAGHIATCIKGMFTLSNILVSSIIGNGSSNSSIFCVVCCKNVIE